LSLVTAKRSEAGLGHHPFTFRNNGTTPRWFL